MDRISIARITLLVVALMFLAQNSRAAGNCIEINAIPTVIAQPGHYCLAGDFDYPATSGNAITIDADHVTLDFDSHRVNGFGGGMGTTAIGVFAAGRRNITITNGTLTGFRIGIKIDLQSPSTSSAGARMLIASRTRLGPSRTLVVNAPQMEAHKIEGMTLLQSRFSGIYAVGDATSILGNRIIETGSGSNEHNAIAIYLAGQGARIRDNDIHLVTVDGETSNYEHGSRIGILCNDCDAGIVEQNRISETGRAIYIWESQYAHVVDNHVIRSDRTKYDGISAFNPDVLCIGNLEAGYDPTHCDEDLE
ncbi:MAG: right-handed parallel beta-helix repeat-containing protein [Pseudomonadota bacterium]